MKFFTTVCIVLACLALLVSQSEGQIKFGEGGKVRLCGRLLTSTLQNLCVNGLYTNLKKKSVPETTYDDDVSVDGNFDSEGDMAPFYPSFDDKIFMNKGSMLSKWRRRRNGIVNECCHKQCSINTLLTYCD
uniref:Insulin-like domain-containing protein n=1 Tax=Megaselia scalaris TaxID=36166 RepID=T1GAC2_MEGSC